MYDNSMAHLTDVYAVCGSRLPDGLDNPMWGSASESALMGAPRLATPATPGLARLALGGPLHSGALHSPAARSPLSTPLHAQREAEARAHPLRPMSRVLRLLNARPGGRPTCAPRPSG